MKVCHVIKATGIAGAEGHLLLLLPALRARGVTVGVVVLVDPAQPVPAFLDRFEAAGVPATAIPIRSHIDLRTLHTLRAHFRQQRPDVVHTHLIHADLHAGLAARLAGAAPVISSRHNEDAFRRRPVGRWLMRPINALAQRLVAISDSVRTFTIRFEGVRPAKIETIRYGFQPPAVKASAVARRGLGLLVDAPLIVCVARYTPQKGLDVLIEAWRAVQAQHPQARLALVGDGPDRDALMAQVAAAGLVETVQLTGWRDDALDWIAAADVVVLPSRWEGFGLVLLEAMAMAKPIIASGVSAIPEVVIDGETGRLTPPDAPGALSAAMVTLLADENARQRLGQAGRARLETQFTVEVMADRHLDLYARCLKERKERV